MDDKEKRFEEDIETYFLSKGGYTKGDLTTYSREKATDMVLSLNDIPMAALEFKN
ncbi:hypothetical protein [Clostridium drakei]|uniref:hypothetical protein n=1 Tax=Clostridium drakei TaxID=332101 RepID=UPI000AC21A0C|nr:hypothetical protein [Clostridium drakei]